MITEDVGNNQSLEELCADWVDHPPAFLFKKKLIEKVAHVARVMHKNGICHRDFYICHFLLIDGDEFKLSLIDLHRALIKKNLSLRWIIKDIGSIAFSALDIGLTKHDVFRFMKIYTAKTLGDTLKQDAKFWLKVERRAENLRAKNNKF